MALVVRAFPVRDRNGVDAFVRELAVRSAEAREFYTGLGVRRESWFLQEGGNGEVVIGVTEVEDPIAPKAERYADAWDPFSTWFKAHVYALSGVDPDTAPMGPVSDMVHDATNGVLPANAKLTVRVYPLSGNREIAELVDDLRPRAEALFVQRMENGPLVIAVHAADRDASEPIYEFVA